MYNNTHEDRIDALFGVLEILRKVEPKMSLTNMIVFLAVARRPGLGPEEYYKHLGTILPIVKRALAEIGPTSMKNERALGLVKSLGCDSNLQPSRYVLTAKGANLLKSIMTSLARLG